MAILILHGAKGDAVVKLVQHCIGMILESENRIKLVEPRFVLHEERVTHSHYT